MRRPARSMPGSGTRSDQGRVSSFGGVQHGRASHDGHLPACAVTALRRALDEPAACRAPRREAGLQPCHPVPLPDGRGAAGKGIDLGPVTLEQKPGLPVAGIAGRGLAVGIPGGGAL